MGEKTLTFFHFQQLPTQSDVDRTMEIARCGRGQKEERKQARIGIIITAEPIRRFFYAVHLPLFFPVFSTLQLQLSRLLSSLTQAQSAPVLLSTHLGGGKHVRVRTYCGYLQLHSVRS